MSARPICETVWHFLHAPGHLAGRACGHRRPCSPVRSLRESSCSLPGTGCSLSTLPPSPPPTGRSLTITLVTRGSGGTVPVFFHQNFDVWGDPQENKEVTGQPCLYQKSRKILRCPILPGCYLSLPACVRSPAGDVSAVAPASLRGASYWRSLPFFPPCLCGDGPPSCPLPSRTRGMCHLRVADPLDSVR